MKKITFSVQFVISLLIIMGFSVTTLYSYISFQKLFQDDVEAVSELTSENIYGNINNLMDRPMNVSIAMANDTFLRDFMDTEFEAGLQQEHLQTMKDYLQSYQQKYQFDSVFFVSTKTGAYYHFKNGIDRVMAKDNPENIWYYDFLEDPRECALNVDNDEAKADVITIFVNCKLYDEEQNLLGVVGVGVETPYIQDFLSENEAKYGVSAYLIDKQGQIQLSSELTEFEGVNLFAMDEFKDMATAIVTNTSATEQRWYHSNDKDGYVISKYVPNLNWYLVVEKSIVEFKQQMAMQLGFGFLFISMVVVVVIIIVSAIIKKNKRSLIELGQIDQLTGVRNRASYEQEMQKYALQLGEEFQFGIGIFDLNDLKKVNDLFGHQEGDLFIKKFTELLCAAFKKSPVFRIGGDEFAILFVNISEEEMLLSLDCFQKNMEKERIKEMKLSAAFGYAFYQKDGLHDINDIFKEADNRMYSDKARMKASFLP